VKRRKSLLYCDEGRVPRPKICHKPDHLATPTYAERWKRQSITETAMLIGRLARSNYAFYDFFGRFRDKLAIEADIDGLFKKAYDYNRMTADAALLRLKSGRDKRSRNLMR